MTWPAREPFLADQSPRLLHLVPPLGQDRAPEQPTRGRWAMMGANAGPVALVGVVADAAGQVAGFSFTQDLIITAVPVLGAAATALVVEVRRRTRSEPAEPDSALRAELAERDDELHRDLRRQIARLERQLDDMARERGDGGLRGER